MIGAASANLVRYCSLNWRSPMMAPPIVVTEFNLELAAPIC
jgi:hypothetical protein